MRLSRIFYFTILVLASLTACGPAVEQTSPAGLDERPVVVANPPGNGIWTVPPVIKTCDSTGVTEVRWKVSNTDLIEVRVDSPDGNLFAQTGPEGSKLTGNWVLDGTVFYLVDGRSGEVLSETAVTFDSSGCE